MRLALALAALLAAPLAHAQPDTFGPTPAATDTGTDTDADTDTGTETGTAAATATDTDTATATDTDTATATDTATHADSPPLTISGYIQPQLGFTFRPDGLPQDRFDYGVTSTVAGLEFAGEQAGWSYDLYLVVEAAQGASEDSDFADLAPDAPAVYLERATLGYQIAPWLRADLGQMRVPFTAQEQSPNTALLFPQRSGPNQVFLPGADLGLLVTGDFREGFLRASLGAFDGATRSGERGRDKGLLYAARVDLQPLGAFEFDEGDPTRGPLRVGVGVGLIYRGTEVYDDLGYFSHAVRDLRASASARVAVRGFYFQSEVLRRQRTDNLSSRPEITTGAYAQSSYLLPLDWPIGLAPMARLGWAVEDEGFDPRTTVWTEVGLTIYPTPAAEDPSALKFVVQYLGERRTTEGEQAHGVLLSGLKIW